MDPLRSIQRANLSGRAGPRRGTRRANLQFLTGLLKLCQVGLLSLCSNELLLVGGDCTQRCWLCMSTRLDVGISYYSLRQEPPQCCVYNCTCSSEGARRHTYCRYMRGRCSSVGASTHSAGSTDCRKCADSVLAHEGSKPPRNQIVSTSGAIGPPLEPLLLPPPLGLRFSKAYLWVVGATNATGDAPPLRWRQRAISAHHERDSTDIGNNIAHGVSISSAQNFNARRMWSPEYGGFVTSTSCCGRAPDFHTA